jgi:hypothetical protein
VGPTSRGRSRVAALLVAALLLGACSTASTDRVAGLEARVERLERSLTSTTSTTSTTVVPLDELEVPPISLPVEQARTRLQRRLPAQLDALWQAEWCRDHPAVLGETAAMLEDGVLPLRPSGAEVERLLFEDPDAFGGVCSAALAAADDADAADYADIVDAAVDTVVAEILAEAADTNGLETALERLTLEERRFCSADLESVYDAAFSAGRLPQGASPDLERYWSVVRPEEFAAACRIAAAAR